MKVVTFKAENDLIRQLDDLAASLGVTRSDVIREALEMYLRKASGSE